MGKGRLEAFSDGVIAILITIMVLDLKVPDAIDAAALRPLIPVFGSYVLSFVYLGIYWTNHHHLFHAADRVTGAMLWANLHLLFWLSLVPFVTSWMGASLFGALPMAAYGVDLLCAAIAYFILVRTMLHGHGPQSRLAVAIGSDFKGKVSIALYLAAVPTAFVSRWVSGSLYVLVALMWLVPDRRIESRVERG